MQSDLQKILLTEKNKMQNSICSMFTLEEEKRSKKTYIYLLIVAKET